MKTDLNNKIALVTGGTSEIGTAICKQLAASGAQVVTDFSNKAAAKKWQSKMKQQGFDIKIYAADLRDFDSCDNLLQKIEQEIGAIDIVINSNESNDEVLFKQMDKSQWDEVLTDNLDTVFNVCRHIAAGMSERGFGRIINIASVKARMGKPGQCHYTASKAGMHGFTMALAQEVAHNGVTVNTVSPGYLNSINQSDIDIDDITTNIPAARLGMAEEVAYLIDFLCSEQAGYINGSDIPINGGLYMNL